MTIGIYALWWQESDTVYIGQSINIEKRFSAHNYRAYNDTDSIAINDAYFKYGTPTLVLLEKCTLEELDSKEIEWITQFDTINKSAGGLGGNYGYNSGKCDYSKEQLLEATKLLGDSSIPLSNITKVTGVGIHTLQSIIYRKRHFWLEEIVPELYCLAINSNRLSLAQETRFATNVILVSPDGKEYTVTNLTKFAKEHNLNKGHICAVARGDEKSHKNWKRKEASYV